MRSNVLFFRDAFLRHAPRRYAVMLNPDEARRLDQKYNERQGEITDAMIRQHLTGEITLAAPAAIDGRAHLLPLDVDAGGILAIHRLIEAAQARALWAFGQYCPRAGADELEQRGYVWIAFERPEAAERLQLLGEQLIGAALQDGWKVEARAHAAVTRLPMARHKSTGRFGELIFCGRTRIIDDDPAAALDELRREFHENPVSSLPIPPLPVPEPRQERQKATSGPGITIDSYNHAHDLVALLESYGARPARGSRRLMHCCGHEDSRRASLLLWKGRGEKLFCKCLSEHHNCPLSGQIHDAFEVYRAMEGLSVEDALRRLNGKEASK